MWEKHQDWTNIMKKYSGLSVKDILEDKEKLE